jgi:hypothetical protein
MMSRPEFLFGAALAAMGCGPLPETYIEARGRYEDGREIVFREKAQRIPCDSTKADAPCVTLMALRLTAPVEELLRGVRITFTPSKMSAQTMYSSGLLEPVTVYGVKATTDRFVDLSINGGEIQFNQIAGGPEDPTSGTFGKMTLRRSMEEEGGPISLTLESGSFYFAQSLSP